MIFVLESMSDEEVRNNIRSCEGKHMQQVAFSTFHDSITQVCYSCKKIRTSILGENSEVKA